MGGHDACMECCLKLVAPFGVSLITPALSLNPFSLCVGGGSGRGGRGVVPTIRVRVANYL